MITRTFIVPVVEYSHTAQQTMNSGPLLIMLAAALWAVDALIRTPLTQQIPASGIVFLEHLIGFLVLSPVFVLLLKNIPAKLAKNDWLNLAAVTLVSSIGGTLFFTEALKQSFSSGDFVTPLLLQKTQPLIVIALSVIFLKERLTPRYLLFTPLALLGSYLMSFGLTPPALTLQGKELVFVLALGAALGWGSGTIFSKNLLKKLNFAESTAIRFLAAIPMSFVVMLLLGQTVPIATLNSEALLRFVLIAISTGAVGLLIYYKGLARTEAKISTISELTFPLVSIVIAITPLNPYGAAQTLTGANIVGIVFLLTSVLVISLDYAHKTAKLLVAGTVIRGKGDGKKLGFPTANIALTEALTISYGVYACLVRVNHKTHHAVLHFGPRMVFGENKPQFEVHILDFKQNLYGKKLSVEIRDFIRGTQTFPNLKIMVARIKKDVVKARRVLAMMS